MFIVRIKTDEEVSSLDFTTYKQRLYYIRIMQSGRENQLDYSLKSPLKLSKLQSQYRFYTAITLQNCNIYSHNKGNYWDKNGEWVYIGGSYRYGVAEGVKMPEFDKIVDFEPLCLKIKKYTFLKSVFLSFNLTPRLLRWDHFNAWAKWPKFFGRAALWP